ncbi:DNA methyltransferase [Clostridium botulinum]
MKRLPNDCIDLIIADPPYYKIVKDDWDNQWNTEEDYLEWCKIWTNECYRRESRHAICQEWLVQYSGDLT